MKPINIPLTAVESSQIAAIGHHPDSNTLAIQFSPKKDGTPGSIYHYSNFDAEAFDAFKSAESIGSHFGKFIKAHPGKYPYVRIEPVQKVAA